MRTSNDTNKYFSSFESIAPLMHSPGAKIVFTALSLRSLSLLLGKNNAFYVTMIALGAISNWVLLMNAKEFIDQRVASLLEEYKYWKQLSSSIHTPIETEQNPPEAPPPQDVSVSQAKSPGNVSPDLVKTRNAFLTSFGVQSPVKKSPLKVQSNDGVLLAPDNIDSSVLVDE